MELLKRTTVALAAVAAIGAALPKQARADILPQTGTPSIVAAPGGLWDWTYTVVVTAEQTVNTGNSFTIYDFGSGTLIASPANWSASQSPLSPSSVVIPGIGTVTPTQDATLNWTFTYTGVVPIVGPQVIGQFTIRTNTNSSHIVPFVGQGTDNGTNLANANITNSLAPVATPEPASIVLLGTGMLGLVGFARRRNKSE